MSIFSGTPTDLQDALAYELHALNHLRSALFRQIETSDHTMTVTLGDVAPDGDFKRHLALHVTDDLSSEAVRAALGKLRPLAFSAAFKMQDMVAEWILRANGFTKWPFKLKLKAHQDMSAAGTLVEPPYFVNRPLVSKAFWALYRHFVPYRGTVIHSGGVILDSDGTVEIIKDGTTMGFTDEEQAAYIRSTCLIAECFTGRRSLDPHLAALLDADLARLARYHAVPGFTVTPNRTARLVVNVPESELESTSPLTLKLDFAALRRTMLSTYPAHPSGTLFFSATIIAMTTDTEYTWRLPIEAVPQSAAELRVGEPSFDLYLSQRRVS